MKKILSILFICVLLLSCSNDSNYQNITSSSEKISYFNLIEKKITDNNGTIINCYIPKFLERINNKYLDENTVVLYQSNDMKYVISIEKLESYNTVKLDNNDKKYIELVNQFVQKDLNNDLDKMGRLLPPELKNVKVIYYDGDLIINNKHFTRLISYYNDTRKRDMNQKEIRVTNFKFVTLFNKRKYQMNISYYGDDKDISNLTSLFNTIGGSVKFE